MSDHLKLPEWDETDPLRQLKAIRKEIAWAFDDWCRGDNHHEFRMAMADFIKQLCYLQPFIDGVASWYDKPTERLVACAGPSCATRRVHHERPDTPRGQQYVRVPLGYDGQRVFCSLECQSYFKGKKINEEAKPE